MTTIIYANPAFYVFLVTFTAFILLLLTTLSIPLVSSFYFLYTSQANGVRFGMWGWCLDSDGTCSSPLQLGYTWEPEIAIPITKALVFYPISVIFTFFTMASLMPVLCARNARSDKIFDIFAWLSFGTSALAFFFMIGMFDTARKRFERRGFDASFGNLPWMSLSATLLLLGVSISPFFFTPPPKPKPIESQRRRRPREHDLERGREKSRRREISRRPTDHTR
ncbi:unnamed protein product [Cyclocybe aegerita]|uniref:Uncharacterized protein n=1 Tax=Cyclocybe aegerita TaxID=1973307 RepID=A0A8S0XZF6_CYCAE|nr:unnamed protein product [Cyclocybe aegerita]